MGASISLFIWTSEAVLDHFFFDRKYPLIHYLILPTLHEVWTIIIIGLIIFFSIISQILYNKIQEDARELEISKKKMEEAYRQTEAYKDLFSHDISNIFQIILSSSQLLEQKLNSHTKSEEINKYFNLIQHQINKGVNLSENITKATKSQLEDSPFISIEICKLLREIKNQTAENWKNEKIKIKLNSCEEEIFVKANELLIDIFENIIFNAIYHNRNDEKCILIKISKIFEEDHTFIKIEFIDNGIGVEDSKKIEIFEHNFRSRNKGFKGMGMGLSIVKKLIDGYGGLIWIEDRVPGDYSLGSKFIVRLLEA